MSGHIRQPLVAARSACTGDLACTVAEVVWQDEDEGAIILRGTRGEKVTCATGAGEIVEGQSYRFLGSYQEHPQHGRQFAASAYLPSTNGDKRGTVKYLCELGVGIGQARAEALWQACEHNTLRWLRECPDEIAAGGVIPFEVAFAAAAKLRSAEEYEQAMVGLFDLFAARGFGKRAIKACLDKWGNRAHEVVGQNPWQLLLKQIPGAGFKRVDKLYVERGGNPIALKRQAMAGWYALSEASDGSTWQPLGVFHRAIIQCAGVSHANFEGALILACRSGLVEKMKDYEPGKWLADPAQASAERRLALALANLCRSGGGAWPSVLYGTLTEHQAAQVAAASRGPFLMLTGTPGTGKTFVAGVLLKEVARQIGTHQVAACAPTGKAAARLTEVMRGHSLDVEAKTVHRLLRVSRNGHDGQGWGFQFDQTSPLPFACVCVDEASMLDTQLAASLFSAIRPGTLVLVVGDPYQLPPVGPGAPLRDMIAAGLPRAEFSEIKRNSGMITDGCRFIKDGRAPHVTGRIDLATGENLRMVQCLTEDEQLSAIGQILGKLKDKPDTDVVWDVQVLTPTNESSKAARKPLNDLLQAMLNPPRRDDPKSKQDVFRLRDKVICLKNTIWDKMRFVPGRPIHATESWSADEGTLMEPAECLVANGELGRVLAVSERTADVILEFDNPVRRIKVRAGKRVNHKDGTDSAREEGFGLGYALTIHKSQGSQWPWVIVVLDPAGDRVASREAIYTAISRAEKATLLVGNVQTLLRQIRRAELPLRKTFLKELIEKEMSNESR